MRGFPSRSRPSRPPSDALGGPVGSAIGGRGCGPRSGTRHGLRIALLLAATAALVMAFAPAATSQAPVTLLPKKGGLKQKFVVKFRAPLAAVDSADEFYVVDVRGPRGCRQVMEFTMDDVAAGERVVLRLTPRDDIFPLGRRSRWCPGRYSGVVVWCPCADGDTRDEQLVGRVSFRVLRRKA